MVKRWYYQRIRLYCGYEHYYPYDERYQRVYDMCVEYGYPLMIHTGDAFSDKLRSNTLIL